MGDGNGNGNGHGNDFMCIYSFVRLAWDAIDQGTAISIAGFGY